MFTSSRVGPDDHTSLESIIVAQIELNRSSHIA